VNFEIESPDDLTLKKLLATSCSNESYWKSFKYLRKPW